MLNSVSFDSMINMLELNNNNRITFLVKRVDANQLKIYFVRLKCVYFSGLNNLCPIKLKKTSEYKLYDFIESKSEVYMKRVKHILSCRICIFYDVRITRGISSFTSFKYIHCCHRVCLID